MMNTTRRSFLKGMGALTIAMNLPLVIPKLNTSSNDEIVFGASGSGRSYYVGYEPGEIRFLDDLPKGSIL